MKRFLEYTNYNSNLVEFLMDKPFKNKKTKRFYYHGTSKHPDDFNLIDDYDFEDSNVWSGDLPEGYLFLTSSLEEAKAYGKYIIPCEFENTSSKVFKVNTDMPSVIFDRDYGIDLFTNDKYYGFWEKFEESGKSILVIQGNNKMTLITNIGNVIPRTDLASNFYSI